MSGGLSADPPRTPQCRRASCILQVAEADCFHIRQSVAVVWRCCRRSRRELGRQTEPVFVQIGSTPTNCPNVTRVRPMFGRSRPERAKSGPMSNVSPTSTKFGSSTDVGPTSAKFGQTLAEFVRIQPSVDQLWQQLGKTWAMSTECGPIWVARSRFCQLGARSTECGLISAAFGRVSRRKLRPNQNLCCCSVAPHLERRRGRGGRRGREGGRGGRGEGERGRGVEGERERGIWRSFRSDQGA